MQQPLRWVRVFACLCAAALLLAACSGIPKPFSRETGWFNVSDPKSPPVTITVVNGPPKDTVDRLVSQLYTESKLRGYTATVGTYSRSNFTLQGNLTAAPTAKGTTVVYVWDVTGPGGSQRYRISGEESLPADGDVTDSWAAVDDATLQRIAANTADEVALFISKLGYGVLTASVPPPASMLTDEADSIQTASLTGNREALKSPGETPPAEEPTPGPEAAKPEAKKPAKTKPTKRANAIAVPLVTGARGRGNTELATAMRRAMLVAGVPVIKTKRNGAITVAGTVKLGPPAGSVQMVELSWKVLDPKGAEIGTISQRNQVPAGSLDQGWGTTAQLAADAAAGGIFKLLSQVQ